VDQFDANKMNMKPLSLTPDHLLYASGKKLLSENKHNVCCRLLMCICPTLLLFFLNFAIFHQMQQNAILRNERRSISSKTFRIGSLQGAFQVLKKDRCKYTYNQIENNAY